MCHIQCLSDGQSISRVTQRLGHVTVSALVMVTVSHEDWYVSQLVLYLWSLCHMKTGTCHSQCFCDGHSITCVTQRLGHVTVSALVMVTVTRTGMCQISALVMVTASHVSHEDWYVSQSVLY